VAAVSALEKNAVMSETGNKELVRRAFDALAAADSRPLLALLADDARWTVMGRTRWSGAYEGKEKILRDLLGPLGARLADRYRATAERILADGPFVVVQARGHSTTKAGARYDNEYCFVYRMDGGRIKDVTEYLDTELVTAALTPEA
jgi:ketosteroid isomerase-like protein